MQIVQGANDFLVFIVLTFVATLLLIEGLYLLWRARKGPEVTRLKRRLQSISASSDRSAQSHLLKERMLSELPFFERVLQSLPRVDRLDRALLQSGLTWSVSGVLLGTAALFVAVWMIASDVLRLPLLLTLLAGAGAAALPLAYVFHQRGRRLATITRQLPDTLDLMIRALRAGHAFTAALKMAGDESSEPIAGEFRMVHDQINFGVSMQQALTNLSERVPSTDLRYFVVAVLIQRDSGGNLTEVLSNLAKLIRERAKLMGRVRVLSTEGRLSAWILGLMPFFLAGAMHLVNPKFMSLLWTDPIGIQLIQYMLTLMAFGALVMRKIVRIRV